MFLCKKCHKEAKCNVFDLEEMTPFRSYGRCEDCREVGDCVDCHGYGRG